jgi:hypothetical protein
MNKYQSMMIGLNIIIKNKMHRTDNSRFLLYIEPTAEQKSKEPIDDELTRIVVW